MLNLEDIESYFPEHLRKFKKNLLREYLQYKILKIIFDSKIGQKLSFIGETALRIIYNISRFSEDLDFDNFQLQEAEFNEVSKIVKKELELEGFKVEVEHFAKNKTFHYEIKFSGLYFENKLSPHSTEKILIKVDTQPHEFEYKSDIKLLNKFDIFTQINVTPIDILLSQKIRALFSRKQGRDFYDIIFLLSKIQPNYDYLKQKLNIDNSKDLKQKLLLRCKELDFKKLAKDVERFLFNPNDSQRITLFKDFIKQAEL